MMIKQYEMWADSINHRILEKEFQYLPKHVAALACVAWLCQNLTGDQLKDMIERLKKQ